MSSNVKKYVGDFETTTDPEDCRVWASCLVGIDKLDTAYIGTTIAGMMDFLKTKNSVVYFHNLKFDGEFIVHYLLENGFKQSDTREPNTFDTLITDTGVWYSITVYFAKKNKKHLKVTFYDSLKKLPFKVSVISKAFELRDEKLSIDYDAYRAPDHELTEEEREYIVHDCRIVAEALRIQFSKGLKRMTNASDALHNFKDTLGKNVFEKWFPELPVELDADIRRAYKGGFTYLNPRYKNARVKGGITLDVNSLYPSVMYDRLLPYGYPMFFEGEPEENKNYPLFIVRLRCAFEVKPDHIPTLQLKNNRAFIETEYLTSSNGEITEFTLTSVDLALFLEHYDVLNLEYINGWRFKGASGMFKEYIDFWMNIKETTTGALRQLAKLMLNSLYGKFATNPKSRKKSPVLDLDGVVQYVVEDEELRAPIYTAMGAFITAYAREKTIRSAQSVYTRFCYADTDSLHLEGYEVPEGLEVHKTKLGAWKHEGEFVDSLFIRPKTYLETMREVSKDTLKNYAKLLNTRFDIFRESDGIHHTELHVTCAGMPDNVKEAVTYENFHSGSTFGGKLMPKRVKGGVVLVPTTFTIK